MPYKSMDEVNPAIKGIDPPVTLAQANIIASWADEITGVESPWAVAIANFKKAYRVEDGRWVKRAEEADMSREDNLLEVVMKKETTGSYPASAYLVVEDPEKSTTFHLRVLDANGNPDRRQMGQCWAALTTNFRGNPYKGPDKEAALAKLKALYKKQGWDMPGAAEAAVETLAYVAELLEDVKRGLASKTEEAEPEVEECALAETYAGVELLTEGIAETDGRGPLTMKIQPIRPGFGNAKDNNYYPASMLKRDARVMVGAKMHESDHKDDKSTRTWVSTITDVLGFSDAGAPVCEVVVHDPDFAQRVRNLAGKNLLDKLECSILGDGKFKKGEVDGRKANIVEALTRITDVDWVTRAGAGGKALAIAESGEGDMLDEDQKDVKLEEDGTPAKPEEESPPLGKAEVTGILAETNLPEAAKNLLAEAEYASEAALREAVAKHVEYLKAVTGSGKPFGHEGGGTETRIDEAEYTKRYAAIMERHGVRAFGGE